MRSYERPVTGAPGRGALRLFRVALVLGLAAFAALLFGASSRGSETTGPVTVTDYTDPGQAISWGQRSHWKQPWRSYLDTVPAATLIDAVGINFNVPPRLADGTARLLAGSGFRRARIEVGWGSLDYDDPSRLNESSRQSLVETLTALRDNGIRPLIVLNANHGKPCPVETGTITLTKAANPGATLLKVSPEDRDEIVPGRTGISIDGIAARSIFTAVDAQGSARLSQPLSGSLAAGEIKVDTLRYEPFRPAILDDGSENPLFEETMRGWLRYVGVVTREAKSILGSDDFDVEVWNELTFGSRFLDIDHYYHPDLEVDGAGTNREILARTVGYLRDPAHGVEGVGIGNGFSNTTPWASGSTSPAGLTAIDKHPYAGWRSFPRQTVSNGNRPLDGLGEPAGVKDALGQWQEAFVPTYEAFFPEYYLSAIQTETLVRDIAPTTSSVGGTEHGRHTAPEGGEPPAMWLTEVNLDPARGPTSSLMTEQDLRRIVAKDALRYLVAFVNKGVTAIDFYAADADGYSLIDSGFFDALRADPTAYPGDALGGLTTDAVRRLTASMASDEPTGEPRSISLVELTDHSSNVQFEGGGTAEYPPLYNRDVFGFFPFQVNAHRFVIPVYVMTRNVAEIHREDVDGPRRFDLPPETYGMAIGGVDGTQAAVSADDPLSGESVPVEVLARSEHQLVVEMPVTDSPRLLTIEEKPAQQPEPGPAAPEPPSPPTSPSRPAGPDRPRGTDTRPDPSAPNLRLQVGSPRGFLRSHQLTVAAKCDRPCAPRFGGRLSAGRRSFPIWAVDGNPSASGDSGEAKEELAISTRAGKAARGRLAAGLPVTVLLTVSAGDQSGASTAQRTLTLRRRPLGVAPGSRSEALFLPW